MKYMLFTFLQESKSNNLKPKGPDLLIYLLPGQALTAEPDWAPPAGGRSRRVEKGAYVLQG